MSLKVLNALLSIESIAIMLLLIAAAIVLLVKRHPLAAAGVGVLVLERVAAIAWPWILSAVDDLRGESIALSMLVFNTVSNLLFLVGLGLILAQIFVKRPARGFEGHP
ncbi:hypothetical protein [Allorhizocola rhizosphaerae]|uniref:hypothetical protein n=1 Tax=Allorhizocola rhizosphaerae TaxID=1872709 RepID=UPI0013C33D0D|nr:hypothetical protein [Allorhizocola rhizosphaerae]